MSPTISEYELAKLPWQHLQILFDTCYPRPPRDVFERVVSSSHRSQRAWLAFDGAVPVGLVMLSPHSKGGHLENLAVMPTLRGSGLGQKLVACLIEAVRHDSQGMITLTTRIPSFFTKFGFQLCGDLADGSVAMILLL